MPLLPLLRTLHSNMSSRHRRQLLAVLALMGACAAAEVLYIAAVLPFLTVLTDAGGAPAPLAARAGFRFLQEPLLASGALFAAAALLLCALRLALIWGQQRFAAEYGRELSSVVFSRMIRQPYPAYQSRNSSELLAGIEKSERIVQLLIQPVLQGLVAAVLAIFIMSALLLVDAPAAFLAAATIGFAYVVVALLTRKRMRVNGQTVSASISARNQTVREALGGIRDVLLDASQPLHEQKYGETDRRSRRAQAEIALLAQAPRYVVEAIGAAAFVVIALLLSSTGTDLASTIPVLGALALGGQRLLPLIQQMWLGYSQAASYSHWLEEVGSFLTSPVQQWGQAGAVRLPPMRELRVENLRFAYPAARPVIDNLSFTIEAGERIGIAGPTGCGKSTVLDLVMGLLDPVQGRILIDRAPLTAALRPSWQASIAHVPQAIYLVDDTIAANIALGVAPDRIDEERLAEAARDAQLHDFVHALPLKWRTPVGERGIRLSGGQRQRIGLARALYKQAQILILDEATNALDEPTEAAVLHNIFCSTLAKTIIMVAHRSAALELCTRVIHLREAPPPV